MGFRPEPTIYSIKFEGTSMEGLHVRASACTVDEYNRMLRNAVESGDGITKESVDANEWMYQLFANHLVSWDLEDYITGEPVPTTLDGIVSQERSMISEILRGWQIALVSVPKILQKPSPNGETSLEQSLGLGNASVSQSS